MVDFTPIIKAFIALLAALVTYKLIPWIKSKTTESQQSYLRAMVRMLVFSAEQLYGAGNGKEKMDYVQKRLREKGYDVDVDEIEAAVGEYLNYSTSVEHCYGITVKDNRKPPDAETNDGNE